MCDLVREEFEDRRDPGHWEEAVEAISSDDNRGDFGEVGDDREESFEEDDDFGAGGVAEVELPDKVAMAWNDMLKEWK